MQGGSRAVTPEDTLAGHFISKGYGMCCLAFRSSLGMVLLRLSHVGNCSWSVFITQ
jgi:hypothetical protein